MRTCRAASPQFAVCQMKFNVNMNYLELIVTYFFKNTPRCFNSVKSDKGIFPSAVCQMFGFPSQGKLK